ncbi:2TM domain-containing protein [Cyanobacterium sp. IPPAS B-1200]|uniref:2TM domain-containing protein n=1 Tax=Cyanobacterium sp. IPPAS B-1200 TaxID=1562720 RepID=UPI000852743C|nr:2TM domain-containing protein [Cyanobacterium sp. IPPAS B-1200]OEJ77633.1 hypothetical protein A5482_04935 [Cyanobacterium sp. IPPAS B-1200]
MPPRWPREPDRENDLKYRKLDDRMNFAVHVALFTAVNSGAWFFHNLQHAQWSWITWLTGIWAVILLAHFIYISAIANYTKAKN